MTAADWTKPDVGSLYTAFPQLVLDLVTSAASMDYTGDTNVPNGVIKYDATNKKIQRKEAGVFVDKEITNLADSAVSTTAKIVDGVITQPKLAPALITSLQNKSFFFAGVSTGAANVFAATLSPVPLAYSTGQIFSITAHQTNTGASAVNFNGLGALSILDKTTGAAIIAGQISINGYFEFLIIGGGNCILLNPTQAVWKTWVPTLTGFSADPTGTAYRYTLIGKTCHVSVSQTLAGTSSLTTFTITAPFTAATVANAVWTNKLSYAMDSSTPVDTGYVRIFSGGSSFELLKNVSPGTWTNSGFKTAYFSLTYEVA